MSEKSNSEGVESNSISDSKSAGKTAYEVKTNEINPLKSVISPSGKEVMIGDDKHVDVAMAFAERVGHVEVSKEEDTKVRRKLDRIVMPVFALLYMIQFSDKTSNSMAVVMGLKTDYNMTSQKYAWTTSVFYLCYLVGAMISTFILQKMPTIRTVSFLIVGWGIVQCCHSATRSYAVFIFLRGLLGFMEALIQPVYIIVLNQYYRYDEHFGRMGVFTAFNGVGTIFLSGVSYALAKYKDSYSIEAYKILFIIIGLITMILGVSCFFVMPNTPVEAKWLSEREKEVVLERIRGNSQGFGNKVFKPEQAKECFLDPKTYLYFFLNIAVSIPNGGLTSFTTLLFRAMGYDSMKSILMKMPSGAFEIVGLSALVFISKIIKQRLIVAMIYSCIVLMGICLLAFTSNHGAQSFGIWIYGISPVGIILTSSCVASNTAGFTKKLLTNAVILVGYATGNCVGPQTFRNSDEPNYPKAKATMVGCISGSMILMMLLGYLYYRDNQMREKHKRDLGDAYEVPENIAFADLTDKQNPEFRYHY